MMSAMRPHLLYSGRAAVEGSQSELEVTSQSLSTGLWLLIQSYPMEREFFGRGGG